MAKILPKKKRTLEVYKRAGAKVRLWKEVNARTVCALGGVLKSDEIAKVFRALSLLNEACSEAESRMFQDHPDIGDEYVNVFYGGLTGDPASALDAEIRRMARDFADGLFT